MNNITVEHLLELVSQIIPGSTYDYARPGTNKARLISVDIASTKIQIARVSGDGTLTQSSIASDSLNTLASRIVEDTPISIDEALLNGGNQRSVVEALLLRTAEFYSCKVGRNKNIVWVPSKPHEIGEHIEINLSELHPDSSVDSILDDISELFAAYLKNEGKSAATVDRYVKQVPNNSEVQNVVQAIAGTTVLFDVMDVAKLLQISQKVAAQDFDKNGGNMYSAGINAFIHFISNYCLFVKHIARGNKKTTVQNSNQTNQFPLQQIFYGAPGTGKSRTIKCEVEDKGRIHFRTTFYPDSDYSTFVGCYKPTTSKGKAESKIYSKEELVNILKQIKESGISYPYHKFAYKYWKSVKSLTTAEKKEVLSEAGSSENYSVEFDKAAILGEEYSNTSSTITYQFVPQAFTKAYCEAWNNYNPEGGSEPVFLIIEEINRGNCAQIFGDIFQLLDREMDGTRCGFSTYPIDADEDLKKFLLNGTKEDGTPWLVNKDGIKDGKLCLPANLHIWATMNTSDQSLFPIDSAFKRRWDWKYVPIKRADKEPEKKWIIKVAHDGKTYWCYWWEFLEAINHQIEETTHSEDKQLGYFFAKPKAGEDFISTDTFVNKVIFYLWNDVFKDEDSAVFQYDNDKVEDVSINRSGTMYFRHFMENKDEMIHYFINQLFAMGKENNPVVPIDYLKNDADPKVFEYLPKMRELKVESPSAEENSDEKSDDADSK